MRLTSQNGLDGLQKIKIFENGVKSVFRPPNSCTIPNLRSVAALTRKGNTDIDFFVGEVL